MASPGFLAKLTPRQRGAIVTLAITSGGAIAILVGVPTDVVISAVNVIASALGLAP